MQLWLQDGPMRCHRERGLDSVDDTGPPLLRDPLLYGVALIAALFCAPFFRYLTSLADEGVFLHAATRILGGETIYRDFFEFLPPGGFLIVAAWMKLVGVGFASVQVLAIAVLAAIAALLYIAFFFYPYDPMLPYPHGAPSCRGPGRAVDRVYDARAVSRDLPACCERSAVGGCRLLVAQCRLPTLRLSRHARCQCPRKAPLREDHRHCVQQCRGPFVAFRTPAPGGERPENVVRR
jgi:hypothetical protein